MAIFFWVNQRQWFQDIISDNLAILNARTTSWVLSLLGMHVQQTGTTVITATFPVEIAESCTGSIVFLIFAAAVLPFPSSWRSRLKGLVLGLLALLLINLFRTCLIILVVSRFPGTLWTWHIVIGQIIVIMGMIGVFLWWAKNNQQHVQFRLLRTNKTIFRSFSYMGPDRRSYRGRGRLVGTPYSCSIFDRADGRIHRSFLGPGTGRQSDH